MSKYSELSPCPFCGHEVELCDFKGAATFFSCKNSECAAVMYFDGGHVKRSTRAAVRAFNTRASCGTFTYILIGAAITLIAAVLFSMLFVTERAENVSHETYAPQTKIEERAADDLAGVDKEAEGYAARLFTDADAETLAQMAWGECRGVADLTAGGGIVSAEYQQACTMWAVLNRYDAGFDGDSIAEIVTAPKQFHGYSAAHPVSEELLALAYDVLERWQAEKTGAADVGRVLPAEYVFFVGDGENNYFCTEYGSCVYYTWELPDPYVEEA